MVCSALENAGEKQQGGGQPPATLEVGEPWREVVGLTGKVNSDIATYAFIKSEAERMRKEYGCTVSISPLECIISEAGPDIDFQQTLNALKEMERFLKGEISEEEYLGKGKEIFSDDEL